MIFLILPNSIKNWINKGILLQWLFISHKDHNLPTICQHLEKRHESIRLLLKYYGWKKGVSVTFCYQCAYAILENTFSQKKKIVRKNIIFFRLLWEIKLIHLFYFQYIIKTKSGASCTLCSTFSWSISV